MAEKMPVVASCLVFVINQIILSFSLRNDSLGINSSLYHEKLQRFETNFAYFSDFKANQIIFIFTQNNFSHSRLDGSSFDTAQTSRRYRSSDYLSLTRRGLDCNNASLESTTKFFLEKILEKNCDKQNYKQT